MNIDLSPLINELRRFFHVKSGRNCETKISNIELIRGKDMSGCQNPNTLYVLRLRDMDLLKDHPMHIPILCIAPTSTLPVVDKDPSGSDVFVVLFSDDFEDVLLKLSEIFYRFGQRSSELGEFSRDLLSCRSVEQATELASRYLHNPILLSDDRQHVVTHTFASSTSQNPDRTWIEKTAFFTQNIQEALRQSMYIGSPVVARGEQSDIVVKSLCSTGKVDGYLYLFLLNLEINAQDLAMLDLLGNYCTILLGAERVRNPQHVHQDHLSSLLTTLINEVAPPPVRVGKDIERLGLTLKRYHYVLLVKPGEKTSLQNTLVSSLPGILASSMPNVLATFFRNDVTLLIESDADVLNHSEEWAPLLEKLEEYDLCAGISNSFTDILDIRNYYYQAVRAAELGVDFFRGQRLVPFYKCLPYHLIQLAALYDVPKSLCTPGILQLQKMDQENNTKLVRTLQVYMENGRNKAQTAQKLYLHLNTVKYRLNQIGKVIDLQRTDYTYDLQLYLSLLIVSYFDVRSDKTDEQRVQRRSIASETPPD